MPITSVRPFVKMSSSYSLLCRTFNLNVFKSTVTCDN